MRLYKFRANVYLFEILGIKTRKSYIKKYG